MSHVHVHVADREAGCGFYGRLLASNPVKVRLGVREAPSGFRPDQPRPLGWRSGAGRSTNSASRSRPTKWRKPWPARVKSSATGDSREPHIALRK